MLNIKVSFRTNVRNPPKTYIEILPLYGRQNDKLLTKLSQNTYQDVRGRSSRYTK